MSDYKKELITSWHEKHSESILKYILFKVRDYQQAEDLTQETFIKAYIKFETFKEYSSEKTWLFKIAHNLTVDYFRKQKPIIKLPEFLKTKEDYSPLPLEIIQLKENSMMVYQTINRLKESHKNVILLRKIKGFSIEDTAKILNWTESKVKSTLHRALPALEKELKKEGYSYEKFSI